MEISCLKKQQYKLFLYFLLHQNSMNNVSFFLIFHSQTSSDIIPSGNYNLIFILERRIKNSFRDEDDGNNKTFNNHTSYRKKQRTYSKSTPILYKAYTYGESFIFLFSPTRNGHHKIHPK